MKRDGLSKNDVYFRIQTPFKSSDREVPRTSKRGRATDAPPHILNDHHYQNGFFTRGVRKLQPPKNFYHFTSWRINPWLQCLEQKWLCKQDWAKNQLTTTNLQLTFDNKAADRTCSALIREEARLPAVSSSILFEIFPFIIVFGEDMIIQTIGRSLTQVWN